MRPFYIITLVLSFMITWNTYAGEIILCKDVKNIKSLPSQTTWDLQTNKKICLYYKHDYIYSSNTNFNIYISKNVDGYFSRIKHQSLPVQKGQKTSTVYLDIAEPGNYIVSIIDNQGYIVAEQGYTVK